MTPFTSPPTQMSPYTAVGAGPLDAANNPEPARLGPAIPGTTGGLPALSGLSVFNNPISPQFQDAAQTVQGMGRGEDSMLVHMTPNEVNSLRGLAQRFGGDLSVNPQTGLPEAGWLGDLLPTILGGLGMAFGIPPIWMGALGLAGGTAITGDLKEGLMAGLGAYGGASLAGGLGLGSALGNVGSSIGLPGATNAAISGAAEAASPALNAGSQAAQVAQQATSAIPGASTAGALSAAPSQGFLSQFGDAAKAGVPDMLKRVAPFAAGFGVLNNASEALTPNIPKYQGEEESPYIGPYKFQKRDVSFYDLPDILGSTKEKRYFTPGFPAVLDAEGNEVYPQAYAGGGVTMQEGGFVMPARETAEFGNGSSNAGQQVLSRFGGMPIRGQGDGVSDSVPARIGQGEARVARDEVYFPPHAVRQMGNGNERRGTQKLYSLMERAKDARKRAGVGSDTRLRRGLA